MAFLILLKISIDSTYENTVDRVEFKIKKVLTLGLFPNELVVMVFKLGK